MAVYANSTNDIGANLGTKIGAKSGRVRIPVNKLCPGCGRLEEAFILRDRLFKRAGCGHLEDRDLDIS